jgi:hypothetical protein
MNLLGPNLAALTKKVAHHARLCIRWLRWAWEQLVYGQSEPFPEVRRRIRWQVKECLKNYPEVTCWRLIILAPCPLTDAERVQSSAIEIGSDKGVGEHQDGHRNFTSDL